MLETAPPTRAISASHVHVGALLTSLLPGIVLGWAWAVILGGRAMPWQAGRTWLLALFVSTLLYFLWTWRFSRSVVGIGRMRATIGILLGWLPCLTGALLLLGSIYLSDVVNAVIEQPGWRPLSALGLLLLTLVTHSTRQAAETWLSRKESGLWLALTRAFASRAEPAAVLSLLLVGCLQASGTVMAIGDDIGHYSEVADAIISGRPYPIHIVSDLLQSSGMAAAYPALPFFPVLLALSFSVFGHTLLGVAMPTTAAVALLPLGLFAAFRSVTRSKLVSYVSALLLFMFPVYRLHTIGSPEPDTVFVLLLVVAVAVLGKSTRSSAWGRWALFGIVLGLATLTRPEGVPYAGILFGILFLARWRDRKFWLSTACFGVTLLPFAVVFYSVAGTPWPRTFGGSMLALENFQRNVVALGWPVLPWFASAVGVPVVVFLALLFAIILLALLGTGMMWLREGVLAAVPFAGLANLGTALFVSPFILGVYSPADTLRHLSYGIPFTAVGLVYLLARAANWMGTHDGTLRRVVVAALLAVTVAAFVYEADGLARPEPFLGGRASLLWTADAVTLVDLASTPMEFPWAGDQSKWEVARVDLGKPFEGISLRAANRSQPYAWVSLLAALLGLAYVAARGSAARGQETGKGERRT